MADINKLNSVLRDFKKEISSDIASWNEKATYREFPATEAYPEATLEINGDLQEYKNEISYSANWWAKDNGMKAKYWRVGKTTGITFVNSRAANAIYQGSRVKYVGDDPRWKGMTGIVLRVKDNSEDNRENYYWVDFPGRPSLPESDLVANSRVCNVEPEPRVDGYGQEWYIRLKDGQVWRKRGTKEQMERLGKWLADRIGTQVEFIQPTGLNSRVCNSSNPVVRKAMNACAMR